MRITAWNDAAGYRSEGPSGFTWSELAGLESGQVLTVNLSPVPDTSNAVVGLGEFNRIDCAQFG